MRLPTTWTGNAALTSCSIVWSTSPSQTVWTFAVGKCWSKLPTENILAGENGHLFSSCSEKKTSELPVADDQTTPTLADTVSSAAPVMDLPSIRTGVDNRSVGLRPPFRPLPQVRTRRSKKGNGVSFVREEGRVEQRVLSSMMAPKNNNPYNPILSTSSKDDVPDS